MKKILVIFFLLILVGIVLKGCIKRDVPELYTVNNNIRGADDSEYNSKRIKYN